MGRGSPPQGGRCSFPALGGHPNRLGGSYKGVIFDPEELESGDWRRDGGLMSDVFGGLGPFRDFLWACEAPFAVGWGHS